MAECEIVGTLKNPTGLALARAGTKLTAVEVRIPGVANSTEKVDYFVDSAGLLKTKTVGGVAVKFAQGADVKFSGKVRGFHRGTGAWVHIPDTATVDINTLPPEDVAPSTSALNAHRQSVLDHSDMPSTYIGQAGKTLVVNEGENAIEFVDPTGGSGTWGGIGGTLSDQSDLQAALDLKADASALTSEASARAAADIAEATSRASADTILQANIDGEASARAAAITSASTADRDRANHTGTQSADTLTDGTTNKAYLATERTKLAGIATGATANATDAQLRDRSTHTGTQTALTISDFNAAALSAAPAETTATVGTLINGATTKAAPVDADSVGLSDSAASNILKKLTWANLKATLKTYFDTLYQSLNSALTSIAGLSPSNDDILQRKSNTWTNRTPTQLKTDLALVKADVGLSNVTNDAQVKSINGDTTQAQIIAGADDISVATSAGTTTVRRAAQTGGKAYWMFPFGSWFGAAASLITSANQVRVARLYLPTRITVNSIHFNIATLSAGGLCSVGLYSDDGNTLLVNSGAQSTTAAGMASVTLGVAVTLGPGWYWLAYTHDNATSAVTGQAAVTAQNNILNGGTAQVGAAANVSSAGVLPSTLGTVTASSVVGVAFVKIQN